MNQEYDDLVSEYDIIDCRYPYEFHGGHIKVRVRYIPRATRTPAICSLSSRSGGKGEA